MFFFSSPQGCTLDMIVGKLLLSKASDRERGWMRASSLSFRCWLFVVLLLSELLSSVYRKRVPSVNPPGHSLIQINHSHDESSSPFERAAERRLSLARAYVERERGSVRTPCGTLTRDRIIDVNCFLLSSRLIGCLFDGYSAKTILIELCRQVPRVKHAIYYAPNNKPPAPPLMLYKSKNPITHDARIDIPREKSDKCKLELPRKSASQKKVVSPW